MKVTTLDDSIIKEIGHAFGYYDYGEEKGLVEVFPSRDAAAAFICGYVEMSLKSSMLYSTENGEGYIAYKHPGEKVGLKAGVCLAKAFFRAMKLKDIVGFAKIMSKGGNGLSKKLDKEKKPYIFVGMVCVLEKYQGQGHMRKVLEMAFEEGDRLGVPVILDTDAKSKCDKYMHLGMELAGVRKFGDHGELYDLIRYPDKEKH